jgi:hypothetical protein
LPGNFGNANSVLNVQRIEALARHLDAAAAKAEAMAAALSAEVFE